MLNNRVWFVDNAQRHVNKPPKCNASINCLMEAGASDESMKILESIACKGLVERYFILNCQPCHTKLL